jgi:hypothetical protein
MPAMPAFLIMERRSMGLTPEKGLSKLVMHDCMAMTRKDHALL